MRLLYAGEIIYESGNCNKGSIEGGPLLDSERWKFWKEALEWLGNGSAGIQEYSRRMSKEACDGMNFIERPGSNV